MEVLNEEMLVMMVVWLVYMLVVCVVGILSYVLRSLGVYTIAKRRDIRHPWFAWVPIVDHYLLGCIADQYQYVVKGRIRSRRKVLLGMNIAMAVISMIYVIAYVVIVIQAVSGALEGMSEYAMMQEIMAPLMAVSLLSLPMMVLSIVTIVFRYIALYDLYSSCTPQNNVTFLVLSIIFGVTEPFFIFFNRKKDDGMPPRKSHQAPAAPAETVYQPVLEQGAPDPAPQTNWIPKEVKEPWSQPSETDPWNNTDQK